MPFGYHSTAREVIDGMDLTSRRAVITGGASGIEIETARALAGAGVSVVLAVRPDAAAPVTEALRESTRNPAIAFASLDLSDQHSVNAGVLTGAYDGHRPLPIATQKLETNAKALHIGLQTVSVHRFDELGGVFSRFRVGRAQAILVQRTPS